MTSLPVLTLTCKNGNEEIAFRTNFVVYKSSYSITGITVRDFSAFASGYWQETVAPVEEKERRNRIFSMSNKLGSRAVVCYSITPLLPIPLLDETGGM